MSVLATLFAASIGTANPTPALSLESLSIWALTPITRPNASISGPPEFPWLIGASVWIEPPIEKLFGACIVLSSALTMPLVTVPASPNGLPIAITGSPTLTAAESPRASGCSIVDGTDTRTTARSVELSWPTSLAV
jgi:hypothetical protein